MKTTPKPTDTTPRGDRGGGWNCNVSSWVRAAYRGRSVPARRDDNLGFRCALRGRIPRV